MANQKHINACISVNNNLQITCVPNEEIEKYLVQGYCPQTLMVKVPSKKGHTSDKDCVMQVLNHGCLELAEIDATFKKTDQAQLKSFITKQYDNIRLPYAREARKYKRKTVFCATVNDHQFLSDSTGSTRFWVVSVPKCPSGKATIDFDHDIDMQQVWAQLYEDYYCKGISFRPTDKEAKDIADNNQDNTIISPMEETLLDVFDERYENFRSVRIQK